MHVGNVMVRESSEAQKRAAAAEGGAGGTGTGGQAVSGAGTCGRHVAISFGGDNPGWVDNLDVDFAAIAPFRLSWDIERVLMTGNRKGHISQSPGRTELEQENKDKPDGVVEAAPSGVACDEYSPLSRLPCGVMLLVLEFSQPVLVRSKDGLGGARGAGEGISPQDGGHWKVF